MAPSRAGASVARGTPVYAGLQLRIVAFLLDVMVLTSFAMLFAAGAGGYLVLDSHLNDGNLSEAAPYVAVAIFLAYVFAFVPLYHVMMWRWWGQTVGKMAVHIKVYTLNGGRLSFGRSSVRFFGYIATVASLFLGLVIALFDRERRTLHDRLAGTVVVEVP